MNRIVGTVPDVDWRRPDDVVERQVDPESGMLATPYCPTTRSEIFAAGTEPASVCPLHAGSGEGLPFVDNEEPPYPRAEATPAEEAPRQPTPTDVERRRRENSVRRLLRRIFGD